MPLLITETAYLFGCYARVYRRSLPDRYPYSPSIFLAARLLPAYLLRVTLAFLGA